MATPTARARRASSRSRIVPSAPALKPIRDQESDLGPGPVVRESSEFRVPDDLDVGGWARLEHEGEPVGGTNVAEHLGRHRLLRDGAEEPQLHRLLRQSVNERPNGRPIRRRDRASEDGRLVPELKSGRVELLRWLRAPPVCASTE